MSALYFYVLGTPITCLLHLVVNLEQNTFRECLLSHVSKLLPLRIPHKSLSFTYVKVETYFYALVDEAVSIYMAAFWIVAPCSLIAVHQCFGGTYCLDIQGRNEEF
jgi:hypothetical protein